MRVEAFERHGDGVGGEAFESRARRGCRHRACRRTPRRSAPRRNDWRRGRSSSSGVNAMRTGPCGISGCATRCSTAATISATPALSSDPSSVRPDAVTIVLPICVGQRRIVGRAQHGGGIVRQHEIAPVVAVVDDRPDVVSGHLRGRVDVRDEADDRHSLASGRGRHRGHHVSVLVHRGIMRARGPGAPPTSSRSRTSWPGVLGNVDDCSSDRVS